MLQFIRYLSFYLIIVAGLMSIETSYATQKGLATTLPLGAEASFAKAMGDKLVTATPATAKAP